MSIANGIPQKDRFSYHTTEIRDLQRYRSCATIMLYP